MPEELRPEDLLSGDQYTPALQQAIRSIRRRVVPTSERIVAEAFAELGYNRSSLSVDEARARFNELLRTVWSKTLEVLERYEEPAYGGEGISAVADLRFLDIADARQMMREMGDDDKAFGEAVRWLLKRWYPDLRTLFLSVGQSRKSRGGHDWELQIAQLLGLIQVPYHRTHTTYRVDFMIPDYAHYERNRNQCIVLSAKRTLRERWQEVVDELHKMNCPNVYLATAEDRVSEDKKRAIWSRNIYLVVWDEVKKKQFAEDDSVVSYSHLANVVIPHFAQFWQTSHPLVG